MPRKTAEQRIKEYDDTKAARCKADYAESAVYTVTRRSMDRLMKVHKGVEGTGNNPATRLTHGLSLLKKYQD